MSKMDEQISELVSEMKRISNNINRMDEETFEKFCRLLEEDPDTTEEKKIGSLKLSKKWREHPIK
jgi:hypothetical protein